jgi:hypothetical protein
MAWQMARADRQLCVRFAVKQLHEATAFHRQSSWRVQRQFERRHGQQNTCRGSFGNGSGLMRLRAVLDAMRTRLTSVDIFVTAYPDFHKNIAVLFAHEHDEGCLLSLLF